MPRIVSLADSIAYLQRFLRHNKARGMIAEINLPQELDLLGHPSQQKLLPGGWLLSPHIAQSLQYRYVVFVLPEIYESLHEVRQAVHQCELSRGWQAPLQLFLRRGDWA